MAGSSSSHTHRPFGHSEDSDDSLGRGDHRANKHSTMPTYPSDGGFRNFRPGESRWLNRGQAVLLVSLLLAILLVGGIIVIIIKTGGTVDNTEGDVSSASFVRSPHYDGETLTGKGDSSGTSRKHHRQSTDVEQELYLENVFNEDQVPDDSSALDNNGNKNCDDFNDLKYLHHRIGELTDQVIKMMKDRSFTKLLMEELKSYNIQKNVILSPDTLKEELRKLDEEGRKKAVRAMIKVTKTYEQLNNENSSVNQPKARTSIGADVREQSSTESSISKRVKDNTDLLDFNIPGDENYDSRTSVEDDTDGEHGFADDTQVDSSTWNDIDEYEGQSLILSSQSPTAGEDGETEDDVNIDHESTTSTTIATDDFTFEKENDEKFSDFDDDADKGIVPDLVEINEKSEKPKEFTDEGGDIKEEEKVSTAGNIPHLSPVHHANENVEKSHDDVNDEVIDYAKSSENVVSSEQPIEEDINENENLEVASIPSPLNLSRLAPQQGVNQESPTDISPSTVENLPLTADDNSEIYDDDLDRDENMNSLVSVTTTDSVGTKEKEVRTFTPSDGGPVENIFTESDFKIGSRITPQEVTVMYDMLLQNVLHQLHQGTSYQADDQTVSDGSKDPSNRTSDVIGTEIECNISNDSDFVYCANGTGCYNKITERCDVVVNCPDFSDEIGCKCKDYLRKDRICDRIYDCPEAQDEKDCPNGCLHDDEVKCSDNEEFPIQCIPLDKVCDNVVDCLEGFNDESNCFIVEPPDVKYKRHTSGNSFTDGLLLKKVNDRYLPLTVTDTSLTFSAETVNLYYKRMHQIFGQFAASFCASIANDDSFEWSDPIVNLDIFPPNLVDFDEFQIVRVYVNGSALAWAQTESRSDDMINLDYFQDIPDDELEFNDPFIRQKLHSEIVAVKTLLPLEREGGDGEGNEKNSALPQPPVYLAHVNCGPFKCGIRPVPAPYQTNFVENKNQEGFPTARTLKPVIMQERIVGGVPSKAHHWPFVVPIYRDGMYVCGGTLIAPQWILSASHCFEKFREHYYNVFGGMLRLDTDTPYKQFRTIQNVYAHPHYKSKFVHDIALAKLSKPFHQSIYVSNACLGNEDDERGSLNDVQRIDPYHHILNLNSDSILKVTSRIHGCYAVGWGDTHENAKNPSETLREVEVPILDTCPKAYNNDTFQICAGKVEGGADACQGDSGGPLVCPFPEYNERWFLAGIISHGEGCGNENSPGVYTRVSFYVDWIKDTIKKDRERHSARRKKKLNVGSHQMSESEGTEEPAPTGIAQPLAHYFGEVSSIGPLTTCPTLFCDNRCLKRESICDGYWNCLLGSDEMFCFNNTLGDKNFDFEKASGHSQQLVGSPPTEPRTEVDLAESRVSSAVDPTFQQRSQHLCIDNQFQCRIIPECIDMGLVCNLHSDCIDESDERGCRCQDYLVVSEPSKICDGHPDCWDFGDEKGCAICDSNSFYCEKSDMCIDKNKVCDQNYDCPYFEDESFCAHLIHEKRINVIQYTPDHRPLFNGVGILAFSMKNSWHLYCSKEVDTQVMNMICRYLGFSGLYSFRSSMIQPSMNRSNLPVVYTDYPFRHSAQSVNRQSKRAKRQVQDDSCNVVYPRCTSDMACGMMKRRKMMTSAEKFEVTDGQGAHPWTVNFYVDGAYLCGGTLLKKNWVITHAQCGTLFNIQTDHVVARMGNYRNHFFVSAYDQFRNVVAFEFVEGLPIILMKVEPSFEAVHQINTACLADESWVPEETSQCYVSGKTNEFLIKGHAIKDFKLCDGFSDNCEEVHLASNDSLNSENTQNPPCMQGWSGSLVCLYRQQTFVAVGVYYAKDANCLPNFAENTPTQFINILSKSTRTAINKIITEDQQKNPFASGSFSSAGLMTDDNSNTCKTIRCPTGECISQAALCNQRPDCGDLADETNEVCTKLVKTVESHADGSHVITCPENFFDCGENETVRCIPNSLFCDGHVDCPNGTDESDQCSTCVKTLEVFRPQRICDDVIDCRSIYNFNLGQDESAEQCCKSNDSFRCATGPYPGNSFSGVFNDPTSTQITGECVDRKSVCNGYSENQQSEGDCSDDSDEKDCISIVPKEQTPAIIAPSDTDGAASENVSSIHGAVDNNRDKFGRFWSVMNGIVHFVAWGRQFAYCADMNIWKTEVQTEWGDSICEREGFGKLASIEFLTPRPSSVSYVGKFGGPSINMNHTEMAERVNSCKLINLHCLPIPHHGSF